VPNHRMPFAALILVPALALAGCGQSREQIEMDAKLARAEAAVQRAEAAQHAAEAAAVRARTEKLATNGDDQRPSGPPGEPLDDHDRDPSALASEPAPDPG
jgi:hypothetical protein